MTDAATPTTSTAAGGPDLPQERRLVTPIPGPASVARFARRQEHVAAGVGTTLPVFIEAAGGGVLVDVDGNSLIPSSTRWCPLVRTRGRPPGT